MKNVKFFSFLLIVFSTSLFSCTKESIDYTGSTKEMIIRSPWSIDYYFAGQDKTAQFTNYKFSFTGNGTVTAEEGPNSFNGNWSMLTDVNRNDILRIQISETQLKDLNSQWTVTQLTNTGLVLLKSAGGEMRLRKL